MRERRPADLPLHTPVSWDEARVVHVGGVRSRWVRVGWLSRLLVAAGVLLLGYVAAVKLEATWAQRWAARQLEEQRETDAEARLAPAAGQPVGRLIIPRLELDVVALEGVDRETLERGAGHFPGTALPGQTGNASFAGHRDSFFRALRDVRHGDEVRLQTPAGDYAYRVTETRVVGPLDVEVIDPVEGRHLTLVTCHPFDWIGPAPRRFVVRAALLDGP